MVPVLRLRLLQSRRQQSHRNRQSARLTGQRYPYRCLRMRRRTPARATQERKRPTYLDPIIEVTRSSLARNTSQPSQHNPSDPNDPHHDPFLGYRSPSIPSYPDDSSPQLRRPAHKERKQSGSVTFVSDSDNQHRQAEQRQKRDQVHEENRRRAQPRKSAFDPPTTDVKRKTHGQQPQPIAKTDTFIIVPSNTPQTQPSAGSPPQPNERVRQRSSSQPHPQVTQGQPSTSPDPLRPHPSQVNWYRPETSQYRNEVGVAKRSGYIRGGGCIHSTPTKGRIQPVSVDASTSMDISLLSFSNVLCEARGTTGGTGRSTPMVSGPLLHGIYQELQHTNCHDSNSSDFDVPHAVEHDENLSLVFR